MNTAGMWGIDCVKPPLNEQFATSLHSGLVVLERSEKCSLKTERPGSFLPDLRNYWQNVSIDFLSACPTIQ